MQFLMLVCLDTEPVNSTSTGMEIEEWVEKYDKEGVRQLGDRIQPESAATTIRVRNDEVLVTDGPFVETKEVVAGFDCGMAIEGFNDIQAGDVIEAFTVKTVARRID